MTEQQHAQEHVEIHKALFGDPESGEIGIVQMNREMYQAWSSLIWLGKGISFVAAFVAALATVWLAFGTAIQRLIKNILNIH